ncbi:MAG: biotin--[acetyl-CoA-carboxylase] ligase [Candidatus Marinimicrobia bacterium]|nr:biotin--[acetyl-CoA-carboxylase] ligase [Candidatus Neomarinimicrobiota bacterium]|tara:strand:- start:5306 stop:6055 length:750 start_codon:yes stop_codon:yes gene_type:complete
MKFNIPDYLSNLDSQSFGKKILYLPETKSTNDDIWENFNNDHLIIITDNQTAGKGQRGREWISQQFKSLTFSIGILDDNKNSKLISLKSAISIAKTINDLTGLDALIKWPNDILINNKKVAGILTESKIKNDKRIINIGIGINVNNESDKLSNVDQSATSLMIESNNKFSREILLANLIKCIDSILYKNNIAIINDWNKLCAHKNSLITFHDYKNKLIKGKFIGIDKEGRAIIDINGKLSYYLNGELTL